MTNILDIDCLPLGDFQTNCYVIRPAGKAAAWVFDPGLDPRPLMKFLSTKQLQVERIVITHGHADHIAGAPAVKREFPDAVLTAPALDAQMLVDPWLNLSATFGFSLTTPPAEQIVRDGDSLDMHGLTWQVLDTAGHTPGGVSYYCRQAGVAVVGDALFAGSVGRCDLPGSDFEQLIRNIRQHLLTLPAETRVLSGHGPETTIEREAKTNPFLINSNGFN